MPPKRSPSPSDDSPRKRTKRSPLPNPSPSSPPSPHSVGPNASLPAPLSTAPPAAWQAATSAEIDEALKSIFQLGGQFVVDVSDDQWRRIAKRLNSCVCCEGKSELCSAAGGTELVCDACQWAHKGCSLGIAYQYCLFANRFHAPLSWARQEFESRMTRLNPRSYNSYHQSAPFFTSLKEAIRHTARPTGPPPPSADRVGPPGRGRIVKSSTSQSSPSQSQSHRPVSPLNLLYEPRAPGSRSSPRKLSHRTRSVVAQPPVVPSSTSSKPSSLPSTGVRVVHGPTIRIPPPAQRQAPSAPLHVGNTVIPPGSDLARELKAFEATEADITAANKALFFKQQAAACLAAAETKRRLEAEQQLAGFIDSYVATSV
ncbi:hypothetical protein BT96DRAFT_1000360 [Gymnopus androsaceus JB14]|uniref:Uncharacterized protein n=1 Tax=Gymnopus androsaceus JB14 TaxID=1447944 RepID=A0A6A4H2J0_9AGAR|nr:hypothetical protein BT96DRAFT_1000360 [Gymnopus androsaceus JB14]